MASARTKRELLRKVLGGSALGFHGVPLAPVGALAGIATTGRRRKDETLDEFKRRATRNMALGAAAPTLGMAGIGAGAGAAEHVLARALRKQKAYARRFASGPTGGTRGYERRQRWDPRTGRGFGPAKPEAAGQMDRALARVSPAKRERVINLARMAKQRQSPNEAENARRVLERMAGQEGFSVRQVMKHASWIEGVRMGMSRAR